MTDTITITVRTPEWDEERQNVRFWFSEQLSATYNGPHWDEWLDTNHPSLAAAVRACWQANHGLKEDEARKPDGTVGKLHVSGGWLFFGEENVFRRPDLASEKVIPEYRPFCRRLLAFLDRHAGKAEPELADNEARTPDGEVRTLTIEGDCVRATAPDGAFWWYVNGQPAASEWHTDWKPYGARVLAFWEKRRATVVRINEIWDSHAWSRCTDGTNCTNGSKGESK